MNPRNSTQLRNQLPSLPVSTPAMKKSTTCTSQVCDRNPDRVNDNTLDDKQLYYQTRETLPNYPHLFMTEYTGQLVYSPVTPDLGVLSQGAWLRNAVAACYTCPGRRTHALDGETCDHALPYLRRAPGAGLQLSTRHCSRPTAAEASSGPTQLTPRSRQRAQAASSLVKTCARCNTSARG